MKTRNQAKRWFMQPIVVTAAMAFLGGNCAAAPAELINRYSFESEGSSTAYDSIGGQDGTVQPEAHQIGGSVVMDGGPESYVELPPGLISSTTISQNAVTLEAWADFGPLSTWMRLFDFGDSDGITGGYYLFFTPQGYGPDDLSIRLMASSGHEGGGGLYEDGVIVPGTLANSVNAHIVCVADFGLNTATIYLNGVLLGDDPDFTKELTDIHDVYSYLGKSLYPYDPNLVGSIHEFRIYDGALNPVEVAASYESGPDTPWIPADLKIVPHTLNLNSQGEWIIAFLGLPEGFDVADIDLESIRLKGLGHSGEIKAASYWMDEEAQILALEFSSAAVAGIVSSGVTNFLTVSGVVGANAAFAGTDDIRVIDLGQGTKYVPLPLPELTDDIRGDGWTSGWLYEVLFPSSDLLLGGVPFHFQADNVGNTIFFGGTLEAPEADTLVIPVGLRGVKTVYTLINSAYGAAGATIGSVTFVGSKGDTYTVDLIEGWNVRDHWYNVNAQGDDVFVNTTTDPSTIEAVFGINEPLNAHLDMQVFTLPGRFAGQTLTEIWFDSFLLDPYNAGKPFIAAATVEVVGGAP